MTESLEQSSSFGVRELERLDARLQATKEAAVSWLLQRIDSDGMPLGALEHSGYYRLPWTLAYIGERPIANKVLNWIERNSLTELGDLRAGQVREPWTRKSSTYPVSIVACGAALLGRHDLATKCVSTIRRNQIGPDGGALWSRPEYGSDVEVGYPTAQLGITAILTGQADLAHGCFGWFERQYAEQPTLPDKLYLARSRGQVLTELEPGAEVNFVIDFRERQQAFHTPGLIAYFLAQYSLLTGYSRAMVLGLEYLRLHDCANEAQFDFTESSAVCKLGLGAAALLDAGDHRQMLPTIARMTQWYEDSQFDDGSWTYRNINRPNPTEAQSLEKTAEHVLWVAVMQQSLGAHISRIRTDGR